MSKDEFYLKFSILRQVIAEIWVLLYVDLILYTAWCVAIKTMQFHIIKMNFILDDNIFAFKWLHWTNWHAQVFSVGPKNPFTPGTSLSNDILPQFLKFSLIFMNMQMR